MKVQNFVYRVEMEMEFTKEDVDVLMRCSAEHYDWKCKAQSQQGGIIFGMKNVVEHFTDPGEVSTRRLTWNDIDLLGKITEMLSQRGAPHYEKAIALNRVFAETLRDANVLFEKVNSSEKVA